jgi:Na+-transporting NADH:ubiquinone oxidoreductase subunit NqrA
MLETGDSYMDRLGQRKDVLSVLYVTLHRLSGKYRSGFFSTTIDSIVQVNTSSHVYMVCQMDDVS